MPARSTIDIPRHGLASHQHVRLKEVELTLTLQQTRLSISDAVSTVSTTTTILCVGNHSSAHCVVHEVIFARNLPYRSNQQHLIYGRGQIPVRKPRPPSSPYLPS
eukprot:753410-Hanusia_phi.AAC.5